MYFKIKYLIFLSTISRMKVRRIILNIADSKGVKGIGLVLIVVVLLQSFALILDIKVRTRL